MGLLRTLNCRILAPGQGEPDRRRREYILNVILFGLGLCTLIELVITSSMYALHSGTYRLQTIFIYILCFSLLICGWKAARSGFSKAISYLLTIILLFLATQLMFEWSFELPEVVLLFTLVIVIASILLGAVIGLRFAAISSILIIGVGSAQIGHYLHPNLMWRKQPFLYDDVLGYALVFSIIGLVTWLSNREIARSLRHARQSEAALVKERNSLEIKVAERTKQLEQSQIARIMELQRFATFGKLSAGLVHELSNPLMAATINLKQFQTTENAALLVHVSHNLRHLERYINAARKQLQNDSVRTNFWIDNELIHVISLVKRIAQKADVTLDIPAKLKLRLYGDPVKFNQLVTNLLVNAIEAYASADSSQERVVKLTITQLAQGIELVVHDYGNGITREQMKHIFEPFYSNKPASASHQGLGIGLELVKQFVEQEFNGTLLVTSSLEEGTKFIAQLLGATPPVNSHTL